MRKVRLSFTVVLVLLVLIACASWKSETTRAYKVAGQLGESYRETAKSACDQNLIEPAKCEKLKELNNKARIIWLKAGNVLKLAIKVEDATQRKRLIAEYNNLLDEFNAVFIEIVKLIK